MGWVEKRAAGSEGRGEGGGAPLVGRGWSPRGRPPIFASPSSASSSSFSSSFPPLSLALFHFAFSYVPSVLAAFISLFLRLSVYLSLSIFLLLPALALPLSFLPPSFSIVHPSTTSPGSQAAVRVPSLLSPCCLSFFRSSFYSLATLTPSHRASFTLASLVFRLLSLVRCLRLSI